MSRKISDRGFTLIELLVVIAIIAILAAILFATFMKAKANARQVTCMSNMKQLGTAVQTYVGDNDGAFPYSSSWSVSRWDDATAQTNWAKGIRPYVRTYGIYWCPKLKWASVMTGEPYSISYLGNGYLFRRKTMLSGLKRPAKTVVFEDLSCYPYGRCYTEPELYMGNIYWIYTPPFSKWIDRAPHAGGLTLAWADGHAQWWMKAEDYFANRVSYHVP